ncbi:ABC transporter ATP-binding protein/permease [bacterium]|nr:ABC transporter ATP-binding protein/permease [bacterium]
MILGCFFVVITNLFALLGPWVLKHAIDSLKENLTAQLIIQFAALFVGVAVCEGVFRFLMRKTIIGVSRKIEYDLRNDFFAHIQKLSQAFYSRFKTGDLMARATNDLEAVRQVVGPAVMYSLNTLVSMTAFAIMFTINWQLTLLAMIPFPFMAVIVHRMAKKLNLAYRKIQGQYSDITSRVQENLSGIRIVKAYVQEHREVQLFKGLNRDYIRKNLGMAKIRGLLWSSMTFLVGVGAVIVLGFGGRLVIDGQISLGELVAFFAYLGNLTWPMIALGWVINLVQQGTASMGRLNRIFDEEPEIQDHSRIDHAISEISGSIEFRGVSFSYNGTSVLRNIELKIPKGTTLAIVGRTGSGKSTLINLIPRLIEATQGKVLIDGVDVRDISLQVLRGNIGYAPQDTFLFSDKINANIAFGAPAAAAEEIENAASIAHVRKEILDFPDRFDTILGERGINISGGQKQRTAMARAIIRKPRILILDDCFSAVDTYTEEAILSQLRDVMQARTSIIVSHRISTIKDADYIVVLDRGRIAEQGTHDELLAIAGIYADIHRKQLLEEALQAI